MRGTSANRCRAARDDGGAVLDLGDTTTIGRLVRGAACKGMDTDLFFANTGDTVGRPKGYSVGDAKAVCAGCAVREDCLRYAIENQIPKGIFGGLTSQERAGRRWAVSA